MSRLARLVYTVERYRTLLGEAEARFKALQLGNIITRFGDGGEGWPKQAPFDRILVTAAAQVSPRPCWPSSSPRACSSHRSDAARCRPLKRYAGDGEGGFREEVLCEVRFVRCWKVLRVNSRYDGAFENHFGWRAGPVWPTVRARHGRFRQVEGGATMTAFLSRAAVVALVTSTLGACAMEAPQYPIREAAAPAPAQPVPSQPAPAQAANAPAAYTPSRAPSIIAVNTMASAQPERRDASATLEAAQADQAPPAAETPSLERDQAPITEAPVGPSVLPQVNRRPGSAPQSAAPEAAAQPPTPAPVSRRAARTRTPPAPPPAHPLVAGRVESVDDLSHTIEVEKGDTVNTISDGLMTPKEALIKANRLKKPYELEIGRSLKIPVHKAYVVQSGDSLYGIARRFSTPVDVLSDLNRLDAKSRLRPGQKIALPQLAKDAGPMARPGESAAELAKADDNPAPRREAAPTSREPEAVESASASSSSSRADPYAPPAARAPTPRCRPGRRAALPPISRRAPRRRPRWHRRPARPRSRSPGEDASSGRCAATSFRFRAQAGRPAQ